MSLAFLSGAQRVVDGRARTAAAAGIVVRALLIGAIGLLLGYATDVSEIAVILPYYAVLFCSQSRCLDCARAPWPWPLPP